MNETFDLLLKRFADVTAGMPKPEAVKSELLALKTDAVADKGLNGRQRSAIVSRCDNYMAGSYGKAKNK